MATRETFTQAAQELIGGFKPPISLDTAVKQALGKLDRARPVVTRASITGDGSDELTLTAPPWVQHFSVVQSVWLLDSSGTEEAGTLLQPEEYRVEQNSSGADQLRLFGHSPGTSDKVVVFHTSRHTVDDDGSTVLGPDEEPFAELVAYLALRAVLAGILSTRDQRIATDRAVVDVAQAEELRKLANDLRRSAYSHFGIRDDAEGSASAATPRQASRDIDRDTSHTTIRYRHTHARRAF